MLTFEFPDLAEVEGDLREALCLGSFSHLRIHVHLLMVLAGRGGLEVRGGGTVPAGVDEVGQRVRGLLGHGAIERIERGLRGALELGDATEERVAAVRLRLTGEGGHQVLGGLGAGEIRGGVLLECRGRGLAHRALVGGFADLQVSAYATTIGLEHGSPFGWILLSVMRCTNEYYNATWIAVPEYALTSVAFQNNSTPLRRF